MNQNYHHQGSHLSQHLSPNNLYPQHHRTTATGQINHGQSFLSPPPLSSSQQMSTMYPGLQNEFVDQNASNYVNCTNYQGQHLYNMPQYIQQSQVPLLSECNSDYGMQPIATQVEGATTFYQQQKNSNHQDISYNYSLPYGSQMNYVTQLEQPIHSQTAERQCDIVLPASISEMQQSYHSSSSNVGVLSQYQTLPIHNNYYHHDVQRNAQVDHQTSEACGGNDGFLDPAFDQSQIYYQDQMDLHPTIKQQQEQQAYLLDQSVITDISSADQVSSPILTYGRQTYGQQLMIDIENSLTGASNCEPDHLVEITQHNLQQSTPLAARQQQLVDAKFAETTIPECELDNLTCAATLNENTSSVPISNHQNGKSSNGNATATYSDQRSQPNQEQQRQCELDDEDANGMQQQQVDRPISGTKWNEENPDNFVDLRSGGSFSQDWLDNICSHLIDHMNRFGICVIDNFLGSLKGDLILNEVKQLYSSGQYSNGRLVSNKLSSRGSSAVLGAIRNDRVIWIDGCEDGCVEINNLIQTLCSVVTNSCRLSLYSNNGLDKIVINKRTRAHVACYPGNGTRYIKHVDNPNGDGRVITSIYYLNKNWSTKRDGGILRMFPTGMDEVANIEPLFDRVIFFWSDRRNPHEVLPAFKDRFAITVWYIGETRV